MKKILSLLLLLFIAGKIFSQDTLPKFTLAERGERVTISWTNPFINLIQLNVQRSYDSLRNFSTIYSATSPELHENGFTDIRPASVKVFYRIFYVLEGGSYFFSRAKRATGTNTFSTASGTSTAIKEYPTSRDLSTSAFTNIVAGDKRMVTVKMKDSVYRRFSVNAFRTFRDSILRQTRDTLFPINDSLVGVNPYVMTEAFRASQYVFINKDGFVSVYLPLVNDKKYHIKFFEQDGSALFEIPLVRESPLILDKANFVHSGWFLFELYEDNKLKEKNKLYIPKDF